MKSHDMGSTAQNQKILYKLSALNLEKETPCWTAALQPFVFS